MNKKEWKIQTEINGIPDLKVVPKDLMDAFIEWLVEEINALISADKNKTEGNA